MESKLFQDVPENDREALLEGNAHYTEQMPVQKFFTPEDITDMRREATDNQIKIIRANEKLKKAQEEHKAETKVPISDNLYLHNCIRNGFVEVDQQVYWLADWDNRMMICYDRFGIFIKSRRMMPDERQTKIS
jgi:hypothetical protein